MNGEEDESGATLTAMFIGDDNLLILHIGDSSAVCDFVLFILIILPI